MILQHPAWLIMLIPLAVLLLRMRLPTRSMAVLRGIMLGLLVLALTQPGIKLPLKSGTVLVVVDRSASMPDDAEKVQQEVLNLLHQEMPSGNKLGVVSVGRRATVEHPPQRGAFEGFHVDVDDDGSDLGGGLETALSLVPEGMAGRIVIVSDGRWTGQDPLGAASKCAARAIPVDFRILQRPTINDTAVYKLQGPGRVYPGSAYTMAAWIQSPYSQTIRYVLQSEEKVIARGSRNAPAGSSKLVFRDHAGKAGTKQYRLIVEGEGTDPLPANNRARLLVGVEGQKAILCVTDDPQSGFVARLRETGLRVEKRAPAQCDWSIAQLSGYEAVIIENVQANKIGRGGMKNIASWVKGSGYGLMMTGGKNSYGPGGYFHSPLDPILPVSMELRQEHRKLALAMAVALDRSGSMSMPAGHGRTKMDLANLGTVEVLNLLSGMDEIGVAAVDSIPHVVIPMTRVEDKASMRQKILSIEPMGGGIFVYEALVKAADMVSQADAGTRHIILFADAADSENPAQYKELLQKCRAAGVTVSVIALGTPHDSDAQLLRDIAARGDGSCFFSADPHD